MLEEVEIARLKANLDCRSADCDWHEDKNGTAWCEVCGSGYLSSARAFLRRYYERTAQHDRG